MEQEEDGNERLEQEEDEVQRIWREYFKDLYNIDTQEQVAVHICGFDRIRIGNYFEGEPTERVEVEVRVGKLKNGKAASKEEINGEKIKGGDRVVYWIWRLCNTVLRVVVCLKTGYLL